MQGDLSRRALLGGGAGAALCGLAPPAEAAPSMALPGDLARSGPSTIVSVRTRSPVVAMTFDDGPHPTLTPRLLDILRQRRVRATFYVIGRSVARWPGLARRIVQEGHEIGNHTWRHPYLTGLSDRSVLSEIDRTSQAVLQATGKMPVTMRPPYGAMRRRQRLMVHGARNMPAVLWSVDPQDWRRPGSRVVADRIVRQSAPGAIVLAHDIHAPTIRAMPAALDGLIGRGFRFATMSQLLGWPDWSRRRFRTASAGRGHPLDDDGLPPLQ